MGKNGIAQSVSQLRDVVHGVRVRTCSILKRNTKLNTSVNQRDPGFYFPELDLGLHLGLNNLGCR